MLLSISLCIIYLSFFSANEKLPGIHRSPSSPGEAVENLQRCVDHLEERGVEVSGVSAEQLASGNLKATLMLMNNIRKRYDVSDV